MVIVEVANERQMVIKGHSGGTYVHGKYREYPPPPGLQSPRLMVIVTNSPKSTILHIPISLHIDEYLPS